LFNVIVAGEFRTLKAGASFLGGTLIGCLLLLIFHTAITCFRIKMSPIGLWRKALPTFIIAITTASSSATFSDNIRICVEELGISKRLANFGVPFGQILYKPGVSVLFWFAAISAASSVGAETSVTWIVTALIVCIILSAAAPPVPGGMSASFTILFIQLGLATEDLAIILSITSILDFLITGVNIFTGQCLLAITSRELE
jgi:Na+/H+-dicarboxylate symporter